MSDYVDVAVSAAKKAGIFQRKQFREEVAVQYKDPSNPVTRVDHRSEELIVEVLTEHYPSHAVIAEERGKVGESEFEWLVDPLDGTSNFIRGLPNFVVSIALRCRDELEVGVIYQPVSRILYTAVRNQGALRNDQPVSVADTQTLKSALVGVPYSSHSVQREEVWQVHQELGKRIEGIRSSGSGALDLAYIASGVLDGAIGFDQSTWDRAAGFLLAREAGAVTTDLQGESQPQGDYIVATGPIHDELLTLVTN